MSREDQNSLRSWTGTSRAPCYGAFAASFPEFADMVARARGLQAENMADEIVEILNRFDSRR